MGTKTAIYDLEALQHILERERDASEEQFSPHFYEVSALIEKDEYQEAAVLIRDNIEEGPLDIRLLMYYFYACFTEKGMACCEKMFLMINSALQSNWDSISPSTNRDQHAKKAIDWLFMRIIKNCEFISRMVGSGNLAFFNQCTAEINKKGVEKALKVAYALNETLEGKWDDSNLSDLLMHVVKWIKEFSQILLDRETTEKAARRAPPPPPPEEEEEEVSPKVTPTHDEGISDAMRLLQRKMDAFQYLIEKRDYQKAAVIADDIERLIENFNPLVYLPKVFTRHFSLYARVSTKLDDNRDGGAFRILEKLYQTNLDAFLEWRG